MLKENEDKEVAEALNLATIVEEIYDGEEELIGNMMSKTNAEVMKRQNSLRESVKQ